MSETSSERTSWGYLGGARVVVGADDHDLIMKHQLRICCRSRSCARCAGADEQDLVESD